jgi:hypothetical protein
MPIFETKSKLYTAMSARATPTASDRRALSGDVGGDRFTTANWCRSAMISRCREIRDQTMNRSEWSSERTTDATNRGYLRTYVTSIDAMRTVFLAATPCC